MNIRPCRFPADIDTVMAVLVDAFQFPDHAAWSVPADLPDILYTPIAAARPFWPLLHGVGRVLPAVRSLINGYIAEVDGQAVGVATITRWVDGPYFEISNVGVRQAFRHQGIARCLMQACLGYIRAQGGRWVSLNVVDENSAAVRLYQQLGFNTMAYSAEMSHDATPLAAPSPLPFEIEVLPFGTWRPRYELSQCLQHPYYPQPITAAMLRPLSFIRIMGPRFLRRAQMRYQMVVARTATQTIAAVGEMLMQESTNSATIIGDPRVPEATRVLIQWMTTQQPTTLSVWQPFAVQEAGALGYGVDFRYQRMGLQPEPARQHRHIIE